MVSKRVLSATAALALASSSCGHDGAAPEPTSSGGALVGSGGSGAGAPTGAGGRVGNGGSSAGAPTGGSSAGSNGGATGGGPSDPNFMRGEVPSAGCAGPPGLQSGTQELEVGGLSRTFILDLPGGYDQSKPYPLVFGFHGRDFTAADFRSPDYGNLLSAVGDQAILVHPDATVELGAWELESQQDVEFFDAMLEGLTEGLCVDQSRVFATGHSSGGYFTNLLGCQRGDVLRAIAPLAGAGPFGPDGSAPACERPLSAMIIHAEDDEIVPFSNGEGSLGYWLASDECDADSAEPIAPAPCEAYGGCASGLAVRWCVYEGGHDWPSFAAQGIWDFFKTF